MQLTETTHGGGDGPPLVIAHGLFGSARNWGAIAKRLSDTRRVISVDMRNHGDSPRAETQSYPDMAGDIGGALTEQSDLLGHSMGGKAAMVLALAQPAHLRKLVIADIAPVAYSHTQAHLIAAMRNIDLDRVETRGDADRQLAADVAEPGVRAFLLQSLDVKARTWRINLDVLDREMDKILGFPDIDGQFEGPTLFLTGAESDYVERAHRDQIRALFPNARFASLPGAGHWLHADKPREFEAAVRVFLDS
ncbi:MAG: alpha/beta fold hydrolase [Pseudomonadota bacterium]